MKLLSNHVLLEPITQTKSTGGLYLIERYAGSPVLYRVMLIGPVGSPGGRGGSAAASGRPDLAELRVGQRVITAAIYGKNVEWQGKVLKLVKAEEIEAVVEEG